MIAPQARRTAVPGVFSPTSAVVRLSGTQDALHQIHQFLETDLVKGTPGRYEAPCSLTKFLTFSLPKYETHPRPLAS